MSSTALMTLFRSTNFGSVAQAWASVQATGATVVDYVDEDRYQFYSQNVKDPATRQTWNTEFPLTRRVQTVEEIEELLNNEFTQVLVGSDELLKFRTPNHQWPFQKPFPTPFWLSRRVKIRKVLWAASIGMVNHQDVDRRDLQEAISRLDDFEILTIRDERTLDFIRAGSPELARRVEIVPDPTWLYWPRVLFESPLQFMTTTGQARTYHNLITHLMRCQQVTHVSDFRYKTQELAARFEVADWDDDRIVRQCLQTREQAWEFVQKVGFSRPEKKSSQPEDS